MAIQDQVRALVPRDQVDDLLERLRLDLDVGTDQVEVERPAPGAYRDEAPDLELRKIVRAGRARMIVGALVGAAIGGLLVLVSPVLRDVAWVSVPLLAFGGAWAAMAVGTARGVQVARAGGDGGEELHHLDADDADRLRMLTIRGLRDRVPVEDLLNDAGAELLDTRHPRVGDDAPGARPVDPDDDRTGPPAP